MNFGVLFRCLVYMRDLLYLCLVIDWWLPLGSHSPLHELLQYSSWHVQDPVCWHRWAMVSMMHRRWLQPMLESQSQLHPAKQQLRLPMSSCCQTMARRRCRSCYRLHMTPRALSDRYSSSVLVSRKEHDLSCSLMATVLWFCNTSGISR